MNIYTQITSNDVLSPALNKNVLEILNIHYNISVSQGTELRDETVTARTIGMQNNEGMRRQLLPGEVRGEKL